jgi:hypothetical protein
MQTPGLTFATGAEPIVMTFTAASAFADANEWMGDPEVFAVGGLRSYDIADGVYSSTALTVGLVEAGTGAGAVNFKDYFTVGSTRNVQFRGVGAV